MEEKDYHRSVGEHSQTQGHQGEEERNGEGKRKPSTATRRTEAPKGREGCVTNMSRLYREELLGEEQPSSGLENSGKLEGYASQTLLTGRDGGMLGEPGNPVQL